MEAPSAHGRNHTVFIVPCWRATGILDVKKNKEYLSCKLCKLCKLTRDRYQTFFFLPRSSPHGGRFWQPCACFFSNWFFLQLASTASASGTPISSDATSMILYGKVEFSVNSGLS